MKMDGREMMGLLNKLMKKEKQIDIQKALEANLKYISRLEMHPDDIKKQFVRTKSRNYLTVGEIDCPSGKIIVSDPLAYLPSQRFSPILTTQIPIGTYPVEVSICRSNEIGIRMCTARLKIKNSEAVEYRLATSTNESAAFIGKDGALSGFPVDGGMISLCDEQVANEYRSFLDEWYKKHPEGNHYDDYFAYFFKESEKRLPQFQREGGDFIEWENPISKNRFVMIASGFGDGYYQSFWGYDVNHEICELIVPMVNPDLFEL